MTEITWGTGSALLAAPLVFLLPGWALLSLLLPPESFPDKDRPDGVAWLALAAAASLAIAPIGLLALRAAPGDVQVGTPAILAYLATTALIVLARRGPKWWAAAHAQPGPPGRPRFRLDAPLLVLTGVFALVLAVRLWVVRGVNVGFWGDSYQHTLITQLLLDNGGLFRSWEPYAPLTTFTYHFGLHANIAIFQWATAWFSANATPRTVVLVGQFLNALAALALYPLAVRLAGGRGLSLPGRESLESGGDHQAPDLPASLSPPSARDRIPSIARDTCPLGYRPLAVLGTLRAPVQFGRPTDRRWVGVLAVLIAGLLTPMPMYYVNWGRYTQLAGQIILPAAIWLTMEAVEAPRRDPRRLALAALMVAGLALTHYLVLAFYATFMIPFFLVWLFGRWGNWRAWRDGLLRLAIVAMASIVLILPWAFEIVNGYLLRNLAGFVGGAAARQFVEQENAFLPLVQFVPSYLAIMALAGGVWAVLRRQQLALLLLWVGCQFLLSNPHWLRLPGTGVVNNFTVELWLYMPASILAAYLIVSLTEATLERFNRLRTGARQSTCARQGMATAVAAGGLLVAVAWLGVRERAQVLDPQFQLVTPADEVALAWIQNNTPQNARFLVNSFFAYGDYLIVGSDAGWWLPLLAQRANTVPPLNYGAEAGPTPDYWQQVNELPQRLALMPLTEPVAANYLRQQGITHLFIGEKGGPLLDARLLQASPYYRQVYTPPSDGAQGPYVFEVLAP